MPPVFQFQLHAIAATLSAERWRMRLDAADAAAERCEAALALGIQSLSILAA